MRSLLAVPATNPRFLEKAAASDADGVFIDLEDAVIPELKVEARARAVAAIDGMEWGAKRLAVRVNDLATPWAKDDLAVLAAQAKRLDFVILPKCSGAADVKAVEALLGSSHIRIAALVENALGVANVEAIAAASDRMVALVFGPGDYGLSLGILDGTADTSHALARIGNAARAHGLLPIDGPWFEIANPEGCRAACARAAALGFAGKMAIHPSQVSVVNEAFSPSAQQLEWAREVLEAMEAAGTEGRGAAKTKDGKMIDLVHIKIAREVIQRAAIYNPRR